MRKSLLAELDTKCLTPQGSDKELPYVAIFNYGRNLNPETFLSRIRNDWTEVNESNLIDYFMGIYKIEDWRLVFNKVGQNGTNYANVQFAPENVVYGAVYVIPKIILFNTNSGLNRSEGCVRLQEMEHPQNHYYLRTVCRPKAHNATSNAPQVIENVFMYKAPLDRTGDGKPSSEYIEEILKGLQPNGVAKVPQDYIDLIKQSL